MDSLYRYEIERIERERERREKEIFEKTPNKCKGNDKRYISLMSSISHTYGNVLAWFQQYMLSLVPENTFKTIHVSSKIAHRQIRSTNHEFLKKSKPMIIFRPRIADMNEERFLKGTPMIEKQYGLYSTWGNSTLQPFMDDPKHDISVKFQQNRSVMNIDVTMIFTTLLAQMDFVHYLQNAIVWGGDNFISTCLEGYLPEDMLKIISDLSEVPLYDKDGSSKEFVEYMNNNSNMPVTYKLSGASGNKEFYRYYATDISTIFQDLSWDDGEKEGHIMKSYQITFSVRLEFFTTGFYYIFNDNIYDLKLPSTPYTEDGRIIPVFTDIFAKEDLNLQPGWHIFNQASCRLEVPKDKVNIKEMFNRSILKAIEYHQENGLPLVEFLDIKIRRQGFLIREGKDYKIDYKDLVVYFNNNSTYYTYKILICINIGYINDMMKTIYKLK